MKEFIRQRRVSWLELEGQAIEKLPQSEHRHALKTARRLFCHEHREHAVEHQEHAVVE